MSAASDGPDGPATKAVEAGIAPADSADTILLAFIDNSLDM